MNKLIIDLEQVKSPTGKIEVDLKTGEVTPYMPLVDLEDLTDGDFVHFSYYCDKIKKDVEWLSIYSTATEDFPYDILSHASMMLVSNVSPSDENELRFYTWQDIQDIKARMMTISETRKMKEELGLRSLIWNNQTNKIEPNR